MRWERKRGRRKEVRNKIENFFLNVTKNENSEANSDDKGNMTESKRERVNIENN